jgi:hypothetical protein
MMATTNDMRDAAQNAIRTVDHIGDNLREVVAHKKRFREAMIAAGGTERNVEEACGELDRALSQVDQLLESLVRRLTEVDHAIEFGVNRCRVRTVSAHDRGRHYLVL